uniref:site-specific DNA-methyltransferase (adenine-specific) n=1 Tax=uncultured organism TaxID=155900 RepID=M1PVF2_9ZZZZ|nr:DNA adenine methylase [uncultured organism]
MMSSDFLPKKRSNVLVPPIKMQGIKSKLVNFISESVRWDGEGKWVEPFLGSGVVVFNIQPEEALLGDKNKYVIKFYQKVKSGEIDGAKVRNFLEEHGARLKEEGEDYYYKMRDRFNENGKVLYMLFLNRSCYNGMMRFNLDGEFNTPFCKKPNRFRKAYVTKIVNQVKKVSKVLKHKGDKWKFRVWDWKKTLQEATNNDFIYLDPPYVGRHTGYVGKWNEEDAKMLAHSVQDTPAGFAFSMWLENDYRKNEHIEKFWSNYPTRSFSHYYHVGSTEDLRNSMEEGLIIKEGYQADIEEELENREQKELFSN